ncbi:hypothetical protein SUGI_0179010 [Cryptomeria japonica]|nr:hypothetical protein SUGI_0179010 [Cryptomeria japonica]
MDMATRDGGLVSRIVTRLHDTHDLLSASMVCKAWNDEVTWNALYLTVRSRTLLPSLILRFKNITKSNLTQCCDQLEDTDLQMISASFKTLITLQLGNREQPQERISNIGFIEFVRSCTMLEHVVLSSLPNLLDSGIAELARVCKRLRTLNLENCKNLSGNALASLSDCKSLRELSLKGSLGFTPSCLSETGQNCPMLVKICLEIDFMDISLGLKSLALHCIHLQELSLKFSLGDLGELSQFSTLISLHIDTDQPMFFDALIANVAASNRGLKEFVYNNWHCPLSYAATTGLVQNCKSLEKLCLVASRLTESALLCIMQCRALKCLALQCFGSEGQGLAAIGLCGMQLKEFSLRFGRGIRDVELETLMMHSNQELEQIDLYHCLGPSSRGFSTIGLCPNLQSLDLSWTNVDDLSLATIANGAKMLRHLSLVNCEVVSDMKVLSNFRALEHLNVDQCPFVTDEGLDFLAARCSKLAYLSLASTMITDTGLSYLTSCSSLRSLRIPYCRHVQGPGLVILASKCNWIQNLVISNRFRNASVLEDLRKHCCMVHFEVDDMALIPFAFGRAADV